MPDTPLYRAEVTGQFVQFFSRNPKTTTVRRHSSSRLNTARLGMHGGEGEVRGEREDSVA